MFGGIPFGFGGMPGGMPGGMGGRRGPSEPVDNNKFYAELGIEKNATPEEINRAHKKAAVKHHPDRGGDPEKVRGPSTYTHPASTACLDLTVACLSSLLPFLDLP